MTTFIRHDWTLFRNLNTISQKAGVPLRDLVPLVLKELMDNALDAANGSDTTVKYGDCVVGGMPGYFVQDSGPGIPGGIEDIAPLFSISRPLTSSKLLRMPTRGALGNGLRVVSGTVLASGGKLVVETGGHRLELRPRDDGQTDVVNVAGSSLKGTRIEIAFGPGIPPRPSEAAWSWAKLAHAFRFSKLYNGKSNPHWYDSDSFHELLLASQIPLDELFKLFTDERVHVPSQIDRGESDRVLTQLRQICKTLPPAKLGDVGDGYTDAGGYAKETGTLTIKPGRGGLSAEVPFVIEALANPKEEGENDTLVAMVNGTPITGQLRIRRDKKAEVAIFGCGLAHAFSVARRPFSMVLSIITPHMPITTDGKEPDLARFLEPLPLARVLTKASKRLKREERKSGRDTAFTQAEIMEAHLSDAIAKTSGNGKYRFSMRQLFYSLRPYVLEKAPDGKQTLSYNYYQTWIGEYEAARGEIKGMYRDPRGILYHPHTHETISLGTIAVERYRRPAWTFNKVIYIEKKGLFEVLKQARFPERYDCALLSSEGFATRAVRDLIDLLGEDDVEDIHVFCIHDADAPGTMIHQTLTEATIARGARKVPVHNLGLEPWEACAMGLQVESFPKREKWTPVANYVRDRERDSSLEFPGGDNAPDFDLSGDGWADWLQTNRVELNAMTSPQFLRWLEAKFEDLEDRKVIPPRDVMSERLRKELEATTRSALTDEILREAKFETQVKERVKVLAAEPEMKKPEKLDEHVRDALTDDPAQHWSQPVMELAREMVKR